MKQEGLYWVVERARTGFHCYSFWASDKLLFSLHMVGKNSACIQWRVQTHYELPIREQYFYTQSVNDIDAIKRLALEYFIKDLEELVLFCKEILPEMKYMSTILDNTGEPNGTTT